MWNILSELDSKEWYCVTKTGKKVILVEMCNVRKSSKFKVFSLATYTLYFMQPFTSSV